MCCPFFYMVTGFFLYSKYESSNKLLIAAKKWFYLWLKYFAIITFLSIALHLLLNQNVTISLADVTNVIIGNSSYKTLDILSINGKEYGLYVLWFLLSGAYALTILAFACKVSDFYFIWMLSFLLFVVCYTISLIGLNVNRMFFLSIPFLSLGMFIRQNEDKLKRKVSLSYLALSLGLIYIEFVSHIYLDVNAECFLCTPFLVSVIFLLSIKYPSDNIIIKKIASFGRNNSLQIYIYHRFVWIVLAGVVGNSIGACTTFMVTLILSLICEAIKKC